jgi:surface antigen
LIQRKAPSGNLHNVDTTMHEGGPMSDQDRTPAQRPGCMTSRTAAATATAKPRVACALALVAAMLGGCAEPGHQQEQAGTVIGSVVGGVLGAQVGGGSGRTAATIAGTLAGAVIGGGIGRSMDDTDRLKTAQALETTRTGVPSSWRNPDTGYTYSVTPTRTYEAPRGPCREYTMDAVIGGRNEKVHGTACRERDGSWRVLN